MGRLVEGANYARHPMRCVMTIDAAVVAKLWHVLRDYNRVFTSRSEAIRISLKFLIFLYLPGVVFAVTTEFYLYIHAHLSFGFNLN